MRGIAEADAVAALGEALAAGLVVEPAVDRFTFRHALCARRSTRRSRPRTRAGRGCTWRSARRSRRLAGARRPSSRATSTPRWRSAAPAKALELRRRGRRSRPPRALAYEEAVGHCRNALEALERSGSSTRATACSTGLGRLQWQVGERRGRAGDVPARSGSGPAAPTTPSSSPAPRSASRAAGTTPSAVDEELIALLEQALKLLPPGDSGWRARLLGALAWAQQFSPTLERARGAQRARRSRWRRGSATRACC